jgi:hypothetical protein
LMDFKERMKDKRDKKINQSDVFIFNPMIPFEITVCC